MRAPGNLSPAARRHQQRQLNPNHDARATGRSWDFRPNSDQLWLTEGQAIRGARPCNKATASAETCEPKGADFVVVYRATTTYDRSERIRDGNAVHFARNPSSLVFSENDFFGTCPETRTANFDDEVEDFAGPTLWTMTAAFRDRYR